MRKYEPKKNEDGEYVCKYCDRVFEPERTNQAYCSTLCKNRKNKGDYNAKMLAIKNK